MAFSSRNESQNFLFQVYKDYSYEVSFKRKNHCNLVLIVNLVPWKLTWIQLKHFKAVLFRKPSFLLEMEILTRISLKGESKGKVLAHVTGISEIESNVV